MELLQKGDVYFKHLQDRQARNPIDVIKILIVEIWIYYKPTYLSLCRYFGEGQVNRNYFS